MAACQRAQVTGDVQPGAPSLPASIALSDKAVAPSTAAANPLGDHIGEKAGVSYWSNDLAAVNFLAQSLPCLGDERVTVSDFLEARVRQVWPTLYTHYDILARKDGRIEIYEYTFDTHGQPLPNYPAVGTYVYEGGDSPPHLITSDSRANFDPITFMSLHREAACNGSYSLHGLHGERGPPPTPAYEDLAHLPDMKATAKSSPPTRIVLAPPITVEFGAIPSLTGKGNTKTSETDVAEEPPPPTRSGVSSPEPQLASKSEQDAIGLALETGVQRDFSTPDMVGSVLVRDVRSPQDSRQCRAFSVNTNGGTSTWSVACRDFDGRWRTAR